MERHLHLVHSADTLVEGPFEVDQVAQIEGVGSNVVDLQAERRRRRMRYHPSAGRAWLDGLFDDDLDPVS